MERVNLLGVGVSVINMQSATSAIEDWIRRGQRSQYVCVATVNSLMESLQNESYRRIHNEASLVTPDGMPLVWLSRFQGYPGVDRVCGPDLMIRLFERCEQNRIRHFFFGGRPGVSSLLENSLKRSYPSLKIVGTLEPEFEPGSFRYRTLSPSEDQALVKQINAHCPDITWIGLGSPVQEKWMADHVGRINSILIGVGAAFDFHAGIKRRAPRWMQRSGLEWAFRLAAEPRRLWRRYLVRNSQFVYVAFRQLMGRTPALLD